MPIPADNPNFSNDRSALLQQMAQIDSMERGTLSEEYRDHPDGSGGTVRRGPYFKHQVWEAGGNKSRRVPAEEVPQLRANLASHQRFTELAQEYVEITVNQTRRQRAQNQSGADPEAKKNSRRKSKAKGSAKPKPSSS